MSNEISCPAITGDNLIVNTTETSLDTVVGVSCDPGHKLSGASVLQCTSDNYWSRLIPTCIKDGGGGGGSSDGQITLIVICVIATSVALGVILFAVYMLFQNCRQKKKEQNKEEEFENKMREISMCFDVTQDCVGMPAYIYNNRNVTLKGRFHISESSTDDATTTASPSTSGTDVSIGDEHDRVFVY